MDIWKYIRLYGLWIGQTVGDKWRSINFFVTFDSPLYQIHFCAFGPSTKSLGGLICLCGENVTVFERIISFWKCRQWMLLQHNMASWLADLRNNAKPPDGCILWLTCIYVLSSCSQVEEIIHVQRFLVCDYFVSFNQTASQRSICQCWQDQSGWPFFVSQLFCSLSSFS